MNSEFATNQNSKFENQNFEFATQNFEFGSLNKIRIHLALTSHRSFKYTVDIRDNYFFLHNNHDRCELPAFVKNILD